MSEPLISVGIPTYNRAAQLERAVSSVLAQSHANVELVISDNASNDATESVCRGLSERDARVRYLRAPVNRGPTANFNLLLGEVRGDYAMLLSDDDWLGPGYLAACLAELRRRPQLALACGRATYMRDGEAVRRGVKIDLEDDSPAARILRYLRQVDENGVFYGLMTRDVMRRAAPLRNVLGNDWLFVAAIALQGKIATIEDVAINRELDGTSADFAKLAATLGLPAAQARAPHLLIARELLAEIGWRGPAYRTLAPGSRARLALRAAWSVLDWRSLAWHITMPTFAALGRRRGGRWVWQAYLRVTRAAGAGRDT